MNNIFICMGGIEMQLLYSEIFLTNEVNKQIQLHVGYTWE